MMSRQMIFAVPMFFLVPFMVAHAQWSSDPAFNNAICRAGNNQSAPRIISDGRGGAIICWHDERAGQNSFDIYAQRIDKDGFVRWTVNGIVVSAAFYSQSKPEITTDDAGGAIISWTDNRNGDNDVYAQRIDSSGTVLWTPDGVVVADDTTNQADPRIIPDGKHGIIVTWNAQTGNNPDMHIYAQRVDASGNLLWGKQVSICSAFIFQNSPCIASDGRGGAYIAWAYYRSSQYDVYAQRVDSSGNVKWQKNGIGVATGGGTQNAVSMVADGAGNAFLAYSDYGSGSQPVLQVVIMKKDGPTGSLRVTSTSGGQANQQLSNIGKGLLGIAWEDGRVSGKLKSYAQIIDTTGKTLLTVDGVEASNRTGDQVSSTIASDGNGGVIVAWEDKTRGALETDIYAQRISGTSSLVWPAAGVPICTAGNSQQYPRMITDGHSGAIITWEDYRPSFNNAEIYAARILADGTFPIGPPILTFSSKSVAFGGVTVGSTSTKNITLTNTGGVPVTIASITSTDPQFSLTPESSTIAPSGNVTAAVKFQPTSKNTFSARFILQSNSIFGPDTISVTGSGNATAAIQTDKSSLSFGSVKKGSSKALAIRISNSGNDTLTISSITTTNPKFTVTIASKVLAPGASFDDSVRFSPTAIGPVSGNLTLTSNAPSSPTVVPLSGTGASEVTVTIDHANISYGDVVVGAHKDTTVTITNTGNDTLRISSFTSGNPRFTVETPITLIAPAGVKIFTVRFAPDAAGPLSTVLTVTSNAVSSPNTITVDGIGVTNPAISLAPPQLPFGSVTVGSRKDLVLTVNNSGGMKLTVSSIVSTNADFAALVGQFEVQGGGSFHDTIRFTPSVLGDRSGRLIITSNAATSPDTVLVQGTGTDVSAVHPLQALPGAFTLFQNYPNPFQLTTAIRYDLQTSAPVRVTVLNTLGQVVATLADETQHPGVHTVQWTPAGGTPGMYFYVLRVGAEQAVGTMVFVK
jgi:hypothetical protein